MANISGVVQLMPNRFWEGVDGLWSTFNVSIGIPGQSIRLLPGTSATASNSIWTVVEQGCSVLNANTAQCAERRGGLFHSNTSSTWSVNRLNNKGLFGLSLHAETPLDLLGNDNAYYGFDEVTLGSPGTSEYWSLSDQVIAGIATNDFWFGVLGLSPYAVNFSNADEPVPSFLQNLRTAGLIGSRVWAYTAGAWYRDSPDYGSLTLGGYDAERVNNSIQIPMYADTSRDLLVGIQSITYDSYGSPPLLAAGIYAFLDSLVAQIWLPIEVCEEFEKVFNLTWSSAGYYFVDNDTHAALRAQNPTFTFTLGAAVKDGETVEIKLPYSAFDLNISTPYVNATQRYFPLKRASDSSQYTVGRVFFQEAYVVADYDRAVFNVSQALPSTSSSKLIAIKPPQSQPSASSTTHPAGPESLSNGSIAGIVVAGAVICALGIVGIARLLLKRRARRSASSISSRDDWRTAVAVMSHVAANEPYRSCEACEIEGMEEVLGLSARASKEMPELHAGDSQRIIGELPTIEDVVYELPE